MRPILSHDAKHHADPCMIEHPSQLSDQGYSTSFLRTPLTAGEMGAQAASQYLNSHSNPLREKSTDHFEDHPRLSVGIALAVGIAVGRFAFR